MSLNAVNIGMNKYCGPAVLSILTGKSTDECARVIGSINGKYTIEGVELGHLLQAAERLGFDNEKINHSASLFGTLIRLVNNDGVYIVAVAKHFVAIEVTDRKILFCDNHTKEPMPASGSARLEQSVKAIYKVTKRREPLLVTSKIVAVKTLTPDSNLTYCVIHVMEKIIYDMEKYNATNTVAHLKFKSREQYDEFITSITVEF